MSIAESMQGMRVFSHALSYAWLGHSQTFRSANLLARPSMYTIVRLRGTKGSVLPPKAGSAPNAPGVRSQCVLASAHGRAASAPQAFARRNRWATAMQVGRLRCGSVHSVAHRGGLLFVRRGRCVIRRRGPVRGQAVGYAHVSARRPCGCCSESALAGHGHVPPEGLACRQATTATGPGRCLEQHACKVDTARQHGTLVGYPWCRVVKPAMRIASTGQQHAGAPLDSRAATCSILATA